MKWILGAVLGGLVVYAFGVQHVEGQRTCVTWLLNHWGGGTNYSHGPLIPFIALGLLWWKRKELLAAEVAPMRSGAWVVTLAMAVYYVGVKAVQPRVVTFSLVVLLYGLALTLGGREVFRATFFPVSFLLLMIPMDFLDNEIGLPLRQFVAYMSTVTLNAMGITTMRVGSGTAIHSSVFQFDVDDPCSGIRSLMALTTVTAAYAYLTQTAQWKRWVLFASAIPLAVLGNLARVISIALVAQVYGQQAALKMYHDYSGYIVFGVALSAMVAFGVLLNVPYRRMLENWLKPLDKPHPADTGWRTDE